MLPLASRIRRFLASEEGPTAVEYAVMLALIIVVCLAAIDQLGDMSRNTFRTVRNQLSGS
jgi:pilus assembly protein Flp/PilA